MEKILLIANPVAGRAKAEEYSERLKAVLEENYQADVIIKLTQKENDAVNWSKQASSEGFDTVICLGGDGTVSETVEGIMESEPRPIFGFVPLGTVNDLGRALGYSMDPEKAVAEFASVKMAKLDIGLINKQAFINVIALGSIAEAVEKTQARDKNKLGVFAYIRDGVKSLFTDNNYQLRITRSDGQTIEIETNLLVLALTNSVGGMENMFPEARYDDGLLHFAAVKGHTPIDMIRATIEKGFSNFESNNLLAFSDKEIKIEAIEDKEVSTNIDGDLGPNLPVEIRVEKHALDVILPNK